MQVAEIKTYLKKHKITYDDLSARSGIPIGTLKSIFSGRTPNPRIDTINTIVSSLNLNKPATDWTDEEKALGVGRYATYLSEEETEWLELRSEVLRVKGEDYLKTLTEMIEAVIKQKK